MLLTPGVELAARAARLAGVLRGEGLLAEVEPGESAVGGGACPDHALPSTHVVVRAPGGVSATAARLRAGEPAVIVRLQDDALRIDPRTLGAADEPALVAALRAALRG
jgi:L-seryl-tRNA(Ser) seleniumtransferase